MSNRPVGGFLSAAVGGAVLDAVSGDDICLGCEATGLLEYRTRRSSLRGRFACAHVPGVSEVPDANPGAHPATVFADASDDESYGEVTPLRRSGSDTFWLPGQWFNQMKDRTLRGYRESHEFRAGAVSVLVHLSVFLFAVNFCCCLFCLANPSGSGG
jgi:hypothetical protein